MTAVDGDQARAWVARTYEGLADVLESGPAEAWDAPSLCAGWQLRHVVAHVSMPVRLPPERFGLEMAAAGGDFGVLSDTVADRDAVLPVAEHLAALRSPVLHAWQPPGGGAAGAVNHAVIHSLDVTLALGRPPVAPPEAVSEILRQLDAVDGSWFGVDPTGVRLEATDTTWSRGDGEVVRGDSGELVALLAGRRLPDGRELAKR
ncbi:maleylpyruvate isomerase family mycothiol-dependent enzyme [Blastococcus sp. TF02A-26]|uniref:maleylpyruvate isomerase family mycothiol-dependent enzyme n=1 Tax=Blastococcus sp. TF02A-26 TaxID=2250577 RepID=UPI000DE96A73|nr:maleylpyruvate isomerase family mycothiol-dependent enzyme [Blastococcus sp. TF02A-26]RBY81831.1 maleylpyruvate isomerase family mycothiol-dependent enzyme [Blastococcus sp. TF02A-26]